MFRCVPDRHGGNEGLASSSGGVALVPPAAAAEAVQDCGAAAADAAAEEPSDDEKSNQTNDQPSPPHWTALTAKASNALVGIASSDGAEALVSCELVGNSTLSSVDLGKEVVDVVLSLADGLVQVVIGVPAVPRATLDSDCECGEEDKDGQMLVSSHFSLTLVSISCRSES